MPLSNTPRQGDLGASLAMLLANLNENWIVHELAYALSCVVDFVLITKGRVMCDMDAFLLVEICKFHLLQPRMHFHLVSCWDDICLLQQTIELGLAEIGDADGLCFSGLECLLHRLVRFHIVDARRLGLTVTVLGEHVVARLECAGPVHEVEVNVVGLEVFEGSIEGGLNIVGIYK